MFSNHPTLNLKDNRVMGVFDPSVRPLLAVARDPVTGRDMGRFFWLAAGWWQAGGRLAAGWRQAGESAAVSTACWLASRQTRTLTRRRLEGAGTHCPSAPGGPPCVEHQSAHPPPAGQQPHQCWWVSQRCSLFTGKMRLYSPRHPLKGLLALQKVTQRLGWSVPLAGWWARARRYSANHWYLPCHTPTTTASISCLNRYSGFNLHQPPKTTEKRCWQSISQQTGARQAGQQPPPALAPSAASLPHLT